MRLGVNYLTVSTLSLSIISRFSVTVFMVSSGRILSTWLAQHDGIEMLPWIEDLEGL